MEEISIEDAEIENANPPWFRLRAAFVHLYTASGAVLTLLIVVAAFQGDAVRALWLMLAALLVDSTDGLLARRLRVSEALPYFDGVLLDNIVDYMTYVLAPMLLLWSGGYLDRKSTRLNSSHANISYAVFCLKKTTKSTQRYPAFNSVC